jgi:hypothetical protein
MENGEFGRISDEEVVAYFKLLIRDLPKNKKARNNHSKDGR